MGAYKKMRIALTLAALILISSCEQIDSAATQIQNQTGIDVGPFIEKVKHADRAKYMRLGMPSSEMVTTAELKYNEALTKFIRSRNAGDRKILGESVVCLLYVSPPAAINAMVDMQRRIRDGDASFNTFFEAAGELARPMKVTVLQIKKSCGNTINHRHEEG